MKPNITVAISAYNEEESIKKSLMSIISQRENKIKIKEIIVISDGSTDNTVKKIKSINDSRIKLVDDGKRLGKSSRINNILKTFSEDYLIVFDADMYMKNNKCFEYIIDIFKKNSRIHFVGGSTYPLPGVSFIEKTINNYRYGRESLRKKFNFGRTAYGVHAFLALSREFANSITVPYGILNDDAYLYFGCLRNGYKCGNSQKAIAFYRSPQTIKDHVSQATRHFAGGYQLLKYFDSKLLAKQYKIPFFINLQLMIYQIKKNFFGYAVLKIIDTYCLLKSKKIYLNYDHRWTKVVTSKSI